MGERTEGMKKQAQELIEQAYQRGYKAGYEEGKGQTWSEEAKKYEIEPEKSLKYIEQGRNEAWKAVKKIYLSIDDGGLPSDEIKKIFGMEYCYDIMTKFSASEVIAKIKAYEQKKQEEDETKSLEPKMGHWIKKMVRGREELYCSNCGEGIDVIYEYNFCPNCGAKMEEGE